MVFSIKMHYIIRGIKKLACLMNIMGPSVVFPLTIPLNFNSLTILYLPAPMIGQSNFGTLNPKIPSEHFKTHKITSMMSVGIPIIQVCLQL